MLSRTGNLITTLVVLVAFCVLEVNCKACTDVKEHCRAYGANVCTLYSGWASDNCRRHCGFCIGSPKCKSSDWTPYSGDNTCFQVLEADSWDNARRTCGSIGGDLAIIRSQQKNKFLSTLLPVGEQFWIGLKNVGDDGDDFIFQAVNGASMGSYHPWESNNPDNWNDEERCVTLNVLDGHRGYWNDLNCNKEKRFICEKRG